MIKLIFFSSTLLISVALSAQKNVKDITRSDMLETEIPVGAKMDNRLLSKMALEVVLDLKVQPMKLVVKTAEYISWKGSNIKDARSSGIIDTLIKSLTANNWKIVFDEKDNKVMWLLKDNKPLIVMYVTLKDQIDLYVGELDKTPPVNFQ